jgi:hypothetical protein
MIAPYLSNIFETLKRKGIFFNFIVYIIKNYFFVIKRFNKKIIVELFYNF